MLPMQSDWYRTKKAGVYLVVLAGAKLDRAIIPDLNDLIDDTGSGLVFQSCDSNAASRAMNILGVDDCLKLRSYCLVKT
jgi:hypothetical protein